MKKINFFRKRYIPNERVSLENDEIIHIDEDLIITKWKTLKPRRDFDHGYSCYFMGKGIKISEFYNSAGEFLYYYCDIIDVIKNDCEEYVEYEFRDLLADVVVYKDGFVKVLDVGEIADALESGLIELDQVKLALRKLQELLDIIYAGNLKELTHTFDTIPNRKIWTDPEKD